MYEPHLVQKEAVHYLGIRTQTPFRGMFAVVTELLKELRRWVKAHDLAEEGPFLLRYHVIDMSGLMDIEVGFVVPEALPGDDRVRPATIPAGLYASLVYRGSDVKAVWALLHWSEQQDVVWDRTESPQGEVFAGRYEAYLTDYRVESRKKMWDVELAIKVMHTT